MLRFPVKFAASFVLLLILLSLHGIVPASVGVAGTATDSCCDTPGDQQVPATDHDCADHNCGRNCCHTSILTSHLQLDSFPQIPAKLRWALIAGLSSDCMRLIDYPPEMR